MNFPRGNGIGHRFDSFDEGIYSEYDNIIRERLIKK